MSKILITGSSGLVGRNLLEVMQDKKEFEILAPRRAELDLLNISQIREYLHKNKPDFIVHCASLVGGIAANIANPTGFLVENSYIGLNLFTQALECGVKNVLNLASSCMYPKAAKNPLKEDSILSGMLEPTNEGYALAKILSARLCEYISTQFKLNYKTAIPCNLYGKYDKFDERAHMLPAAIAKIHKAIVENKSEVEIWGDGSARREFMSAKDLADFIIYALNNFDKMPQNLNVGIGRDYSIKEYYEIVASVLDYKGSFIYDTSKPGGMKQKLVDISKLKNFGWNPKISLKDGITETYEYYKGVLNGRG